MISSGLKHSTGCEGGYRLWKKMKSRPPYCTRSKYRWRPSLRLSGDCRRGLANRGPLGKVRRRSTWFMTYSGAPASRFIFRRSWNECASCTDSSLSASRSFRHSPRRSIEGRALFAPIRMSLRSRRGISMLVKEFHSLLERGWRSAFPRGRSHKRAIEHAIALPCVFGRRTISRTLGALGRWDRDWSADYKMFSRCRWKPERLFDPVIDEYLERYPKRPVIAAVDDTKLRKTGRKIKGASWHRDPLSPPFHMNFMYGLRFLQASLLFAHYQEGDYPPRGIPVRFKEAPPIRKPGKRASAQEH